MTEHMGIRKSKWRKTGRKEKCRDQREGKEGEERNGETGNGRKELRLMIEGKEENGGGKWGNVGTETHGERKVRKERKVEKGKRYE